MGFWTPFLIAQALVWMPLVAGYLARRRGWARPELAARIQTPNVFVLNPLIYGLGIWRLEPGQGDWPLVLALMTVLLLLATAAGAWGAPWLARHWPPERRRAAAGAFAIMIPSSNIGHTLAGFLTILLISDAAYSYNAMAQAPVCVAFFLVWMPLARHWGRLPAATPSPRRGLAAVFRSGQVVPLLGLAAGAALHPAGVTMTPGWIMLMKWLIVVSTLANMFAIGLRLRLRRVWAMQPHLWPLYLFKFILTPLVAVALCWLAGLRGESAGAFLIVACMPVGVLSVSLAQLYDLDVDLANAGYLWSTFLFMAVLLPALVLLVPRWF